MPLILDERLPDGWSIYDRDCPRYWVDEFGCFTAWATTPTARCYVGSNACPLSQHEQAGQPCTWVLSGLAPPTVTNIETSLRASRSSWQTLTAYGLDTSAELLNPSFLARALTEPLRDLVAEGAPTFRSNNQDHRPVLDALAWSAATCVASPSRLVASHILSIETETLLSWDVFANRRRFPCATKCVLHRKPNVTEDSWALRLF
jgi:hypothetical protein